ncbi:fluconazole resistance protein (FLU1) [Fusarium denticulatum]|uniref:Fluconazole resistance protein (FLU1) n=1 Tax=Fusarium denticulatum TaxID=48507 RepID=A0A8H6CUK0_9HYPO|nr:fluconazole resistance protein (FLU1) [Fusarium denticulatum]
MIQEHLQIQEVPLGLEALEPSFSLSDHLRSVEVDASTVHDEADILLSPSSWSGQKKAITLLGPFMASTLAEYAAGAYALASEPLRVKWDISDTLFNIGISLFVVGFAFTPMILAPISETHGRYWTFVGSGVVFFLGTLRCAATESYARMMVSRLITGNGAAVFVTLTGGVVSDLYRKEDRNTPMGLYSMTIMVGASLGPLISGTVVDLLGWRWIFFIQVIAIGITTTTLFFLFEETKSNVLLRRKCFVLNTVPFKTSAGKLINFAPAVEERLDIEVNIIWRSFAFPLRLLSKEPIVFCMSLWVSFAWAIMYMQFSSIGLVFRSVYGFDNAEVGAVYTTTIVGSILGIGISLLQEPIIKRVLPHKKPLSTPEQRLLSPCIQSILLPIGLFWFFMTARPSISWVSPCIALGACSMGIFSIYLAVFNYLADTYHGYASSALAAQSLCRNILGGVFPLVAARMLDSLTLQGTGGLLGGLGLLLTGIPWLLYFYGQKIRTRSPFAKGME